MSEPTSKALKRKADTSTESSESHASLVQNEETSSSSEEKKKRDIFAIVPKHAANMANFNRERDKRVLVSLFDLVNFYVHSLLNKLSPVNNRLFTIEGSPHSCNILIVNGLKAEKLEDVISKLNIGDYLFEIVSPMMYNSEFTTELAFLPVINSEPMVLKKKFKSINHALRVNRNINGHLGTKFNIKAKTIPEAQNSDVSFNRTNLLLTLQDLEDFNFPIPSTHRSSAYVLTKDEYTPVSPSSPMFGLDCEMVFTTKKEHELASISLVDESLKSVYESLVKPDNEVTDYLTRVSGITPEKLQNVTKRLADVQKEVSSLLPSDSILIGHALENDFKATKLMHPFVIDSSIAFNESGILKKKTKLRDLAQKHLGLAIQGSTEGHDASEDAKASLQLIQHKLTKDFSYGNKFFEKGERFETSNKDFRRHLQVRRLSKIVGPKEIIIKYQREMLKIVTAGKNVIELDDESVKQECGNMFKNTNFICEEKSDDVVTRICDNSPTSYLTVGHVELESNESVDQNIDMVDKICQNIMRNVSENSLCVIILHNCRDSVSTAAVLMSVKKNILCSGKRGHIDNLEETLNILEQILLQGNVVQKAANLLEMTTSGPPYVLHI